VPRLRSLRTGWSDRPRRNLRLATAPGSWPAAACMPLNLGRRTGPSWSTRRSCARSAGIPWCTSPDAPAGQREPARALARDRRLVTDLGWTPPTTVRWSTSIAQPPRRSSILVVVAVHVAGDAAPLAPRVAVLARQVDAGLQLRDIVALDEIVAQRQIPIVISSVVIGSALAKPPLRKSPRVMVSGQ
jgi:hypothetical protein